MLVSSKPVSRAQKAVDIADSESNLWKCEAVQSQHSRLHNQVETDDHAWIVSQQVHAAHRLRVLPDHQRQFWQPNQPKITEHSYGQFPRARKREIRFLTAKLILVFNKLEEDLSS